MIVYYHPQHNSPPRFLTGARELSGRPALEGGCFFGIGPAYLCGFPINNGVEIEGGWRVSVEGAIDPFMLRREMIGQPTVQILNMDGVPWACPIILREDGTRAFPVRYGKDWKPIISQEQSKLWDFAKEARNFLPRLIGGTNADREELMPVACEYSAYALAYANHISVDAIRTLGIVDTVLATGALVALCSFIDETEDAR
jgi:hypothetical protein